MRAALPDINEVRRCEPCCGKRLPCQLGSNLKNTSNFKRKYSNEVYQRKKNFNCNSKMVVYLTECRVCEKECNGSRASNCKSTYFNSWKEQKLSIQARDQK